MKRLAFNAICTAVILGASAPPVWAAEQEGGGGCTETNYFYCSGTTCTSHQPCTADPGDTYTGCSGIENSGWYSRIKVNTFDCSA
ncbi:MAG: hypothetical protein U0974_14070 [Gemmatimonadales bacterium]|nr:hypothetical protein [Gemmatimonadales bacterium]MDZ4390842.1 hypothetical protein [Gemmatimonadales bacterium]